MVDLVHIWNSKCSRDEGLIAYDQVNLYIRIKLENEGS